MPNLRPIEIIALLLVVLLLFGAKRLPDLARSVGRSLKIFKTEVKDLRDDDHPAPAAVPQALPGTVSGAAPGATPGAVPDVPRTGSTPPHGDPALGVLPTATDDRKQV